ncbi:MAG: YfiR family protein [Alphaproteobacteria bacterium]|nr:YfiR family protein [Alphaproteobacteria bacterium]
MFRSFVFIVFVLVVMVSIGVEANAQTADNEVKAGWIYALIPYIKWNDKSLNPNQITICTLGKDSVIPALTDLIPKEQAKDKKEGRKSKQVTVEPRGADNTMVGCHMLYISAAEQSNYANILKNSEGKTVLTISGIKNFADRGGMIELAVKNDGINLRINLKPAAKSNIVIDSDLLAFADVLEK